MDHRVVLVGAQLGQVPTSVQIQRKFPEESQENVSLLVFLIAFLQGEVLKKNEKPISTGNSTHGHIE
jgi:hypothetical protein